MRNRRADGRTPRPRYPGTVILYATLAICGLAAAALVYRYDLYNREPLSLLLLAVGLGAAVMSTMGPLEAWVIEDILGRPTPTVIAATAAGLEEAGKLAVVLAIARTFHRHFDDPMDGLVYGAMAGLGAALEESVAVLSDAIPGAGVLPPGELVRVAGHLIMGGIGGFGVGVLVLPRAARRSALLVAPFAAAVLIHFAWDLLALGGGPKGELWATLGPVMVMALGLLGFGFLVVRGSRWSRARFDPDSSRRLWGWPFTSRRDERS